jgi:hypothetical protein
MAYYEYCYLDLENLKISLRLILENFKIFVKNVKNRSFSSWFELKSWVLNLESFPDLVNSGIS